MDYLKFNNNRVTLERDEILLIKEFNDLVQPDRNKCKEDKQGTLGLKAIKELSFIYLNHDWKSPYSEFSEEERREASLIDSGLTEKDLSDPIFIQAVEKYQLLQESRVLKLLNAAYKSIDTLRIFFETVDLSETDTISGKPIYMAKDVISNIQNLGKMIEGLQQLELIVKKEREQAKALRGDAEKGLLD